MSTPAVQKLLDLRRELTVDGRRPSAAKLAARIAGFWCPDEVVLYIGCAGPRTRKPTISELSDRVAEYYTTPLGARSPHAGGWWLKVLANLAELHVHYSYCIDYETAEKRMLDRFGEELSETSRKALYDSSSLMPFANLRDGTGRRKRHGIERALAPRVRAQEGAILPTASKSSRSAAVTSGVSVQQLSAQIGVSPKALRTWLRTRARAMHPLLAGHEHYSRWWFTEDEARRLVDEYRRRR